jgi:hypothetical protein
MSFLNEFGILPIIENEEELKKEKFNMFEVMTTCMNKKRVPSDEELSKLSPFLFHNLLSGDINTLMMGLFLDRYSSIIPVENQWKFVNSLVPKYYVPYPKNLQEDKESIEFLQEIYCINKNTAKEYLKMLPKEELKALKQKYIITEGKR